MKFRLSFLFLCFLILQSCSSNRQYTYNSYIGEQPSLDTIQGITADLSQYLSELYPPGHTKIKVINPTLLDGQNTEEFSDIFENALRQKGFEISDIAEILISYTLDSLEDEALWYVHLRLSNGLSIARTYDAFGYSESPRIQMNHKSIN